MTSGTLVINNANALNNFGSGVFTGGAIVNTTSGTYTQTISGGLNINGSMAFGSATGTSNSIVLNVGAGSAFFATETVTLNGAGALTLNSINPTSIT